MILRHSLSQMSYTTKDSKDIAQKIKKNYSFTKPHNRVIINN